MKSNKATDEDKRKMLQTLKRFEEENAVDLGIIIPALLSCLYIAS